MPPAQKIVRPRPDPAAQPPAQPTVPQQFTTEQQLFRAQVIIADLEQRCTEGRTRELHMSANVAMLQAALRSVTAERDALKAKYEPEENAPVEKATKRNGKG